MIFAYIGTIVIDMQDLFSVQFLDLYDARNKKKKKKLENAQGQLSSTSFLHFGPPKRTSNKRNGFVCCMWHRISS